MPYFINYISECDKQLIRTRRQHFLKHLRTHKYSQRKTQLKALSGRVKEVKSEQIISKCELLYNNLSKALMTPSLFIIFKTS